VRLLALGPAGATAGSDPLPAGTGDEWPAVVAADTAAVLDALGIERCGLLAWSGGALAAVATAALHPERVPALVIAAGLVPRQAYEDPSVREAGAARLDTIELADSLPPGTLGEAIAPLLAPYPCDRALAAEHQAEQRDAAGAAELASRPGRRGSHGGRSGRGGPAGPGRRGRRRRGPGPPARRSTSRRCGPRCAWSTGRPTR
jgi:pimeloyl-ACP methyl ester carboxylesterase